MGSVQLDSMRIKEGWIMRVSLWRRFMSVSRQRAASDAWAAALGYDPEEESVIDYSMGLLLHWLFDL
jgi:hypothetical protein